MRILNSGCRGLYIFVKFCVFFYLSCVCVCPTRVTVNGLLFHLPPCLKGSDNQGTIRGVGEIPLRLSGSFCCGMWHCSDIHESQCCWQTIVSQLSGSQLVWLCWFSSPESPLGLFVIIIFGHRNHDDCWQHQNNEIECFFFRANRITDDVE